MAAHDDDSALCAHSGSRRTLAKGHGDSLATELALKDLGDLSTLKDSFVSVSIADLGIVSNGPGMDTSKMANVLESHVQAGRILETSSLLSTTSAWERRVKSVVLRDLSTGALVSELVISKLVLKF